MTEANGAELSAILNATIDGIVSIDRTGTMLSVNPAVTRILGYSVDEMLGHNISMLMPEPFRSQHDGFIKHYLATGQSNIIGRGREVSAQHKDGRAIPIWLSIGAYDVDGEPRFAGVLSDMSKFKQQHKALSESELVNRLTVDNAVIGIALTDLNGKWMRINNALCRMVGYTEEEMLDIDFTRITHPDDLGRDQTQVARVRTGEITNFSHEKRYIRKDGSEFWIRIHVAGVYDDDGRLTHFASQVVDIDAERKALAQKTALQQQIQAFLDHVPANITMKDVDGRYTLVNRKLSNSLGIHPEALIGQTLDAMGFPDRSVNYLREDEAHILRTGEIVEREVPATWDPNCILWATRFPVLGADGAIVGTGSISTDITELKQHETDLLLQARMIGLLQHIAVAVNEADRSHAAMAKCLKLLCQYMDWPFGVVSYPDASGDYLQATDIVYAADDGAAPAFHAKCAALHCPYGEGVSGRAWRSRRPVNGLGVDDSLLMVSRSLVAQLAFPIIVDDKVVAVFECYAAQPIAVDEHLRDLLAFVDAQIGHAIDREAAKRETARALEQLSYHINNSAVGVVQFDRDLRFTAWSPQCQQIFGWRAEEIIGKRYADIRFVHPDDEHLLAEVVTKFDDPQFTAYNLFYRNIAKSGRIVHVDWYNSILRDDNGALISNLAIAVDRTTEVEAQRALREERNLFVAGPAMVFRWRDEPGWPIEYVSPNVASILGYQPADLVSAEAATAKWVHPDDRGQLRQELDDFRQSGASRWTFDPFRLLTASGEPIWVKTYAVRVSGAATDQFVAYAVDITQIHQLQEEAHRQEERLRNVIEGTNAGMWEWNVMTGETVFDDRWAEIVGYTLDELAPISIDTWTRLVHPDDLERSGELLQDHFDGHSDHYDYEARMRHKDGHWVWVHDRGKVVEWAPDGTPLRVAGTHMDVTQRKRQEAAILAANEELRKSNVELEQFAYVASHDLQEPLRMVASFTQLLERNYGDQLDDKAREYIEFAVDGAKRMQMLIKDLLSYSRLGRQDLGDKAVNMDAALARVVQSLRLSIEESSADVVCGALPSVRGDEGQLHQLLQNLVANALKYRGDDAVTIEVGALRRDGECVFFVRDNGIGIDAQYGERIFEIFQRLHTRKQYPGTGIGLSICRRIIERHGGRIWVESEVGQGSTFFFTLQDARVSDPEDEAGGVPGDERSVA